MTSAILKGGAPDLGCRLQGGPFCGSLVFKENLKAFAFGVAFARQDDLTCAATLAKGAKGDWKYAVGANYQGYLKAKVDQDQKVSIAAKHTLSKGFTLTGGLAYS